MRLGLELLSEENQGLLKNKRLGVLAHRASLDTKGRHIIDLLLGSGQKVTTLFGPEHGLKTTAQDMEAVKNGVDSKAGRKIYSLYGDRPESLKPSPEMLSKIDTLIVDLQDVGARYYTYIYTMAFCMEACAAEGKEVIVCDRPNPINGIDIEGGVIEAGFESFVGAYPLATRHGMTIGEIATYINDEHSINCNLRVIKMEGWRRDWYWDDTGIKWTNPSPNMRSLNAALLYPGMCLLEATNVSEGRGTDTPFEVFGAPWIDERKLKKELGGLDLEGIEFLPLTFTPSRQKWEGKPCMGLKLKITDRKKFKPLKLGLAVVWCLYNHPEKFSWRKEPYEFISHIPAIDLLTGSDRFRRALEGGADWCEIGASLPATPEEFKKLRTKHLLY